MSANHLLGTCFLKFFSISPIFDISAIVLSKSWCHIGNTTINCEHHENMIGVSALFLWEI